MKNIETFTSKLTRKGNGVVEFTRYISMVQFLAGFIFVLIPLGIVFGLCLDFFTSNHGEVMKVVGTDFYWDRILIHLKSEHGARAINFYFIAVFFCLYISLGLGYRNISMYLKDKLTVKIDKNKAQVEIQSKGESFTLPFSEFNKFKIDVYQYTHNSRRYTVYRLLLVKHDGYYWELFKSHDKQEVDHYFNEFSAEFNFDSYKVSLNKSALNHPLLVSKGACKVLEMKSFPSFGLVTNTLLFAYVLIKGISLTEHFSFELIVPMVFFALAFYILYLFWSKTYKKFLYTFEFSFDTSFFYLHKINRFSKFKQEIRKIAFESVDRLVIAPVQTNFFLANEGIAVIGKEDVASYESKKVVYEEMKNSIGIGFKNKGDAQLFDFEKFLQDFLKSKGFEVK